MSISWLSAIHSLNMTVNRQFGLPILKHTYIYDVFEYDIGRNKLYHAFAISLFQLFLPSFHVLFILVWLNGCMNGMFYIPYTCLSYHKSKTMAEGKLFKNTSFVSSSSTLTPTSTNWHISNLILFIWSSMFSLVSLVDIVRPK